MDVGLINRDDNEPRLIKLALVILREFFLRKEAEEKFDIRIDFISSIQGRVSY